MGILNDFARTIAGAITGGDYDLPDEGSSSARRTSEPSSSRDEEPDRGPASGPADPTPSRGWDAVSERTGQDYSGGRK